MTMWTALFLIVLIGCVTGILSQFFDSRGRRQDDRDRQALAERIEALEGVATDLKERVVTLERIVTDQKSDLHRRFADLEREQ